MKNILFLISFVLFAAVANAQVSFQFKSQYGNTEDTITNTTAKQMTSPDLGNGKFSSFSVAVNYVEISGTTGGTAKLEYSLDGSIWSAVPVDSVFTASDAATNAYIWTVSVPRAFRYIRVAFAPTGTMSDKVYARFLGIR